MIQSNRISTTKEFVVDAEISVKDVDAFFAEDEFCHATKPLKYRATLINKKKFIALEADIQAELEHACDRCGENFIRSYAHHVSLKLVEATSFGNKDEIVLEADDLDVVTYENNEIDLEHILLESLLLEFDEPCLCREDCKGICPVCRQNLNEKACDCVVPEFK